MTPFELVTGDCRTVLPDRGPFGMLLADPPYGDTSLAWDRRVEGWQAVAAAALAPTASLWVFGSLRYFMAEAPAFEAVGLRYAQEIVWEKHNGSSFHADRFKRVIGGTDGDVIVDDAAGEEVTISKWVTRRSSLQDMADLAAGITVAPIVALSGTAEDMLNSHKGYYARFTNASAKALTVQPNADEALDDNFELHMRNTGAGDLTITEGSGVTVTPPNGGTLVIPQDGTATLKRVASDTFELFGQVTAA